MRTDHPEYIPIMILLAAPFVLSLLVYVNRERFNWIAQPENAGMVLQIIFSTGKVFIITIITLSCLKFLFS